MKSIKILFVVSLVAFVATLAIAGGDNCSDKTKAKCGACDIKEVASDKGAVAMASDDASKLPAGMTEGNIYVLANGTKRFVCPVMKNHGDVKDATSFSDIKGVRYYHCCPGCEDKFQADPAKYLETTPIPGNILRVDGKKLYFKCPVTKEEGMVTADTKYADFNGHRYYFCCADCKAPFTKSPEKYIEKC